MGRRTRNFENGKCYHIAQRSNARRQIFFGDDDRSKYLYYLRRAAKMQKCTIHNYALMSNHIHLVVAQQEGGSISRLMMHVQGAYGRYINYMLRVEGKVWGERFRASDSLDDSHLMSCMAYIDLNPVRAGICDKPGDWPWTSYGRLAFGKDDGIVVPHRLYMNTSNRKSRQQRNYRRFVARVQSRNLDNLESVALIPLRQ